MEKFVLIDGNSLLNRAYYAMSVFTTSDGLPTNGIFGFTKLLLKIIEDQKPAYLAVAFDLPKPTFRHKLYDDYKGTRKPMPDELRAQVPVLKEMLRAMDICIVEKEGYEADDIIGTLSRAFPTVDTYIYTGDRDSYQLVKENVSVCFTKRGVSDLDVLTAENFRAKVGLTPEQIIEEKALMGDSSDNIPGVRGIGPKTAIDLLQRFGTVEKIYQNLDSVAPSVAAKLRAEEEKALISRTLATIDLSVPLETTLRDCSLNLPFSKEARDYLTRLEFRSLLGSEFLSATPKESVEVVICHDYQTVLSALKGENCFAFVLADDSCHVFCGKEYVLPLRDSLLSAGFFFDELKPFFAELFNGASRAIFAESKPLLHKLHELGIAVKNADDVSLLRYLSNSATKSMTAKELAEEYALPEDNLAYAVYLARQETMEKIAGTAVEKLYEELELPLVSVLFEMEKTGVHVDSDMFSVFSEKFGKEIAELIRKIFELAGTEPINLNSPQQLSDFLFHTLGYESKGIKKTARGYSTGADVLEWLAQKHEIPRHILRYRTVQKLQSTYVDGIRPLVVDGVVHTTYNQTATTTGRLSSTNPNLQNIPIRTDDGRELRKLFVASKGNVLVDADYSQIELRLLAHFSECPALVKAYNEDVDIHATTASLIFGVPMQEVTPAMRRRAKTINFGIIYGMSGFGLSNDLNCTPQEGSAFIEKYFASYPEVKAYMDGNVRKAKEDGYLTTILGRKRYIPELKSSNFNQRAFGERAAMNMPLQGSAADIIKIAMLRVSERLKKEKMQSKLVLQVHDELVLDSPKEEETLAIAVLKEEMEGAVKLRVPLTVNVSTGRSWYDAK